MAYGERTPLKVWVVAEQGSPDGTVALTVDGEPSGTLRVVPETPGGRIARGEVDLPVLEVGDHTVRADYLGTGSMAASSSTTTVEVLKAPVAVHVTSSPRPSPAGTPSTVSATVTPDVVAPVAGAARPSGTVAFEVDDYYEGVTVTAQVGPDGTASAVVPGFTGNATRQVLATYSGDARHEPGHGSGTHESLRTATTVEVLSGSWNIYGQMLPIRVQVRSEEPSPEAPTGDVSIRLDGRTLGTVPLSPSTGPGAATTSTTVLEQKDLRGYVVPAGSYRRLTAVYLAGPFHEGSEVVVEGYEVYKQPTTLTATPVLLTLAPLGLPTAQLTATLTAYRQPLPGEPVTFSVGATTLCTATTDADGVATCDGSKHLLLTFGLSYVATHAGDRNRNPSSARGNLVG
ncbi:Ig-like domain repeat protein [Nocardioides sp. J54]|uniref:Ig-like domain repeat protein n=1 Tax=Nocardioides sp. J54 TaxID=935866 RepID=UPI00048B125F|nr:Ig-like domain repeat protein [Nocardioides sp. J54]